MRLNHHPAPGFGDLIPGFFVVPQNPIANNKDRSRFPMAFAGVRYIPKFGEIVAGRFSVPQNPLIAQLRAGMSGCCCDGGNGTNGASPDDTSTGYVNGAPLLSNGVMGGVDWKTALIAVGAGWLLFGRK